MQGFNVVVVVIGVVVVVAGVGVGDVVVFVLAVVVDFVVSVVAVWKYKTNQFKDTSIIRERILMLLGWLSNLEYNVFFVNIRSFQECNLFCYKTLSKTPLILLMESNLIMSIYIA